MLRWNNERSHIKVLPLVDKMWAQCCVIWVVDIFHEITWSSDNFSLNTYRSSKMMFVPSNLSTTQCHPTCLYAAISHYITVEIALTFIRIQGRTHVDDDSLSLLIVETKINRLFISFSRSYLLIVLEVCNWDLQKWYFSIMLNVKKNDLLLGDL